MIKGNILDWLQSEEEKILAIARQAQSDRSALSKYNDQTPGDEFIMTVEDYYGF